MKAEKTAAFLLSVTILLTAAGCKNIDNRKTTSKSTESSVSITTESVTETATETETETESTTDETSSDTDVTTAESKTQESEKSETSEKKTEEETTEKKGFSFSTIVNLSNLTAVTPQIGKQGEKFFDDAVFVGDSVTLGLKNYVTSERNAGRSCLSNAQFLCAGSLGYINSYNGVLEPTYKGNSVRIEDGIKQSGAKKAFIMLGMNDFCGYAEGVASKAIKGTIENIQKKNPDVKIYIESVTPIVSEKQHDSFTNKNIDAFNAELKEICNEYNLTYVDINSVMKDSSGCLNPDYCGDAGTMGIHMSYPGCKAWVNYLVNNF